MMTMMDGKDLSSINNWSLSGNSATTPATNFLGTIDAQDLVFRTRNIEALRINQLNQYVGIGTNLPTAPLHISAPTTTDAIGTLRIEGNEPDIVLMIPMVVLIPLLLEMLE